MNLRFGLDLLAVASVKRSLDEQGSRYLSRIYSDAEIADCTRQNGIDARRLAERFAVKEATLKVLPAADEGLDFRDIELRVDDATERRWVAVHGRAAEMASDAGIRRLTVSVTSDRMLAAAVVAAEIDDDAGGGEVVHLAGLGAPRTR